MTINYDWYTTNYWNAVVYATLIIKANVYNKSFTFNWSVKNQSTILFKICRTMSYFPGCLDKVSNPGSVFTNYSQEHSLSFSPRFVTLNVTQLLIG